jgi:hypothetical protein
MTNYIRPDDQFQWFRDNNKLVPSTKYSVVYAAGLSDMAQNGMATLSPARVTGLFIADPNIDDAGPYMCAVNGTFAIVELIVNDPNSGT